MGDAAAKAEPVDPANQPEAKAAIQKLESEAETVRAFICYVPRGLSATDPSAHTEFLPLRGEAAGGGRCL